MSSWRQCRDWRGSDWLQVGELLGDRPEGAAEQDSSGSVPLHLAVGSGAPAQAIRALVKAYPEGLSRRDADGCLPLHIAASSFSSAGEAGGTEAAFAAVLQALPSCAREKDSLFGRLPLHAAVEHLAPLAVIQALLDAYPEGACQKDLDGNLPIHLAAEARASDEVWRVLGQANPQAAFAKGGKGQLPAVSPTAASADQTKVNGFPFPARPVPP